MKKPKPRKNRTGRGISAILNHVPSDKGKKVESREISPVPTIAADFPKISYKPKNSPDISGGIIFVK